MNQINNVVVVGAGIMGSGIAQNLAQAGLSVKILARHQETLDKAIVQIEANLKLFEEYGLLQEPPAKILSRVSPVLAKLLSQVIQECDFVIETIPEILEAKRETFDILDKCPPHVVIGSNTGSFTITELTEGLKNPGRVVGIHYINPAHIIPAVEIHRSQQTAEETIQTARELMLRVGKKPVMVRKEIPGFIINRLTGALEREIDYLLEKGVVTPEDLDTAIKSSIGFRFACLGPQEIEDMIGLDTAMRVAGRVFQGLSNATGASPLLIEKVNRGELGIKSGKGWYDYTNKTLTEVNDETNKKLLRQLALFSAVEKGE